MKRLAILDDYQGAALEMADWLPLEGEVEIRILHEHIAGAGLDVYDVEPLPKDHPLRRLDNVVLLPHLGYVSENNYRDLYGGAVENVRAWLDGKVINEVIPKTTP